MAFWNDSLISPLTPENKAGPGEVTFTNPPGYSPARWFSPLFERNEVLDALKSNLGKRADTVDIQGVFSGAYSGEAYIIILFVLSGVAGGFLGEIGKDLWTVLKNSISKLLTRHGAPHNLVEVAIEFKECDVIFHAESDTLEDIPSMFDDADDVLRQLAESMSDQEKIPKGLESIEIRAGAKGEKSNSVFYSYRRIEQMKQIAKSREGEEHSTKSIRKDRKSRKGKNRDAMPASKPKGSV